MKYVFSVIALFVSILLLVSIVSADPPSPPTTPSLTSTDNTSTNTSTDTSDDNSTDVPIDDLPDEPPLIGGCAGVAPDNQDACCVNLGYDAWDAGLSTCVYLTEPPVPPEIPSVESNDSINDTAPVNDTSSDIYHNDSDVPTSPPEIPSPITTNNSIYDADSPVTNLSNNLSTSNSPCVIDPVLYRELISLERQLREKYSTGEDITALKARLNEINAYLKVQRIACIGVISDSDDDEFGPMYGRLNSTKPVSSLPYNAVAVGRVCELSSGLRTRMAEALNQYKSAIDSEDFESAKMYRGRIAALESEAKAEREECMMTIVPGLVRKENKTCEVPKELYDELERARYKISVMKENDTEIPRVLRERIGTLESEIARYKAKCNALNVTKDVNESLIVGHYKQRMMETMATDDLDLRVQSLKELRNEIDETIKNMLEQKKKLKYSEMSEVAEKIEFKKGKILVGDSVTDTVDAELEVDDTTDNSSMQIKSGKNAVLLTHAGRNATSDNVSVNESGVYVNDLPVKTWPAKIFEKNEILAKNVDRVQKLELVTQDDDVLYVAEYTVQKRIIGIIPAKAKYELTVDAENGETIQEKKPWWTVLSTTVKSGSGKRLAVAE